MEPSTKKILVIRPDITPQIAKLASTKLSHIRRPIRLMYSGEVLRNAKNLYQSDRQYQQIGAELIGAPYNRGLLEIIQLIKKIINKLKIKNTIIDFSAPSVMRYLESIINFKTNSGIMIKEAIQNKDISLIKIKKYDYLKKIIECSGSLKNAKTNFKKSIFPQEIKILLDKFFKTLDYLEKNEKEINISVDISEGNSFLNYQNLGFKVYNKDDSNVIAIGGDYLLDNNEIGIGITLMTNNICNSYSYKGKEKVYVEYAINDILLEKVIKNNKIYIRELLPKKNSIKEAKSLKCTYILNSKGKLIKIGNIN
jgi:ATP phosphoribosyltransferase regulatory subunit